jgi:hypothetical protein
LGHNAVCAPLLGIIIYIYIYILVICIYTYIYIYIYIYTFRASAVGVSLLAPKNMLVLFVMLWLAVLNVWLIG